MGSLRHTLLTRTAMAKQLFDAFCPLCLWAGRTGGDRQCPQCGHGTIPYDVQLVTDDTDD